MLLSIAYFPPISYFALIAKGETVYVEACENYQKQSWRNRCRYYAADGPQYLNFPVVHEGGTHKLPITEIKVDYSTPWVPKTKRAISSAYESSAYFDFYKDDLFAILDSKPGTLFELDLQIIRFFLKRIGLAPDIRFTKDFIPSEHCVDYRESIHPKRPDTILKDLGLEKPYFQVFARKYGFISNLSIMDLVFNEGPDSISYLRTSNR